MLYSRQEFAFRRSITLEFISDNHAGNVMQLFKELAEKSLGGFLVAAALDQDIEHIAMLIYRSPEIMGLPIDFEKDLVQMAFVATTRASSPQFVGIGLPKCEAPLPDCFIGEDNSTLCHRLFDITKTEREAKILPHSVTDNFWREAIAFVIRSNGVCFHEAILTLCSVM